MAYRLRTLTSRSTAPVRFCQQQTAITILRKATASMASTAQTVRMALTAQPKSPIPTKSKTAASLPLPKMQRPISPTASRALPCRTNTCAGLTILRLQHGKTNSRRYEPRITTKKNTRHVCFNKHIAFSLYCTSAHWAQLNTRDMPYMSRNIQHLEGVYST
jgi:hypothetical protein